MATREELKEWTITYLKNKDLITKKLVKIGDLSNGLEIEYKDKTKKIFLRDILDNSVLDEMDKKNSNILVCEAKKENLDFLINNWKKLIDYDELMMLFVNLSTHQKWIINPRVHARICDEDSLEMGLKTMFENEFHFSI